MTTIFEHNAKAPEKFTPRKADIIEWPGIIVTERPMTDEERKLFEPNPKDTIEWP
jgi:hypothetical protein